MPGIDAIPSQIGTESRVPEVEIREDEVEAINAGMRAMPLVDDIYADDQYEEEFFVIND